MFHFESLPMWKACCSAAGERVEGNYGQTTSILSATLRLSTGHNVKFVALRRGVDQRMSQNRTMDGARLSPQ